MKFLSFKITVITLLSAFISGVFANECDSIESYLNSNGITKDYHVACNNSGDLEAVYVLHFIINK